MSTNKTLAIRLTGIALGLAGLRLMWSQAQQQRQPLTMEKVSENLYVIIGNGGNVAVMPTNEGILLVDDKFAQDAPEIVAKVKTVSDKPIRYVLNTHQHGDHTGGNDAMMAAGAQTIIHKNARENMLAGKQPGLPQVTFADEAQVFLGGKEVQARHLGRGHTNGDSVIYFPSERVLHTGDLFVNGQAPFIDYSAHGSIVEWDQTIQKALQYDVDTVIPGHGPVAKKAELAKWRQTLVTLRTRAKAACAGGAADAGKRIDAKDLGMGPNPNFDRSIAGMCAELSK
ncbi:MAG TPA: MBL fold metallo-hydrolase [Bryobacteraceae bacterium]|nr:MBL fold metallo-hydrolase [Bryobacteraceae bacterium]